MASKKKTEVNFHVCVDSDEDWTAAIEKEVSSYVVFIDLELDDSMI